MPISYITRLSSLAALCAVASSRIVGIPTIPFNSTGSGSYSLASIESVVIDPVFADTRDEAGETLIPPSLTDFAETFVGDLCAVFGLDLAKPAVGDAVPNSVYLTLANSSDYVGASGAPTSEGYTLTVSTSGITISGASPLGVWWGTRTLAQLALLSDDKIPIGEAVDAPGWSVRGMMLDGGRHYYPPEFVVELCSYFSFFKQNTLHLHLSDNLYNNVDIYSREQSLDLYARFRLWSDSEAVAGLNKHKNESYTRDQFDDMQSKCAARGVTIIPELEAPGHALPIVQWKPELGLSTDLSLLNISHPETIPTMKTIWGEFLGWFQSKTVHIGADEYTAAVSEYNTFVNDMDAFISETSGKSVRIWGTFPPEPTYDNINTNVSIQHWEFFEDNPLFDYIRKDYHVVNSDDTFYVVNKWSGSYPQTVPIAKTFTGNPADNGIWQPNIFDAKNSSNNPARSNPLVLGEIGALWNDYGANTSVFSEAYYAWREGAPALADKQWGGDLSAAEFDAAFSALHGSEPGQNLERTIPSKTSTIFDYDFAASPPSAGNVNVNTARELRRNRGESTSAAENVTMVKDTSGNGYDASTSCAISSSSSSSSRKGSALAITPECSFQTPLTSKGRNYTLSLQLRIESAHKDATLLSGADSALMLTPNLSLLASGNYYRLNSTVPLGSWVDLRLTGRGNQTFASMRTVEDDQEGPKEQRGGEEEEFLAVLGINGEYLVWAPIAVEAPIAQIGGGGWTGEVSAFSLTSDAN